MRAIIRNSLIVAVTLSLGCGAASAQMLDAVTSKKLPVKKTTAGLCIAPGQAGYTTLKMFTPFAGMKDCLKSGGRAPKTR